MLSKKYLEKKNFNEVVYGFLKKDLSILPGREGGERYIWSNSEIGKGNFGGFVSEVFCKGKGLDCLDDFDYSFLTRGIENLQTAPIIFVRIILLELGIEIQREFLFGSEGIAPVSKYRIIKHEIEHYKIVYLHGGMVEDAVRYKAKLLEKGGEKIRLTD